MGIDHISSKCANAKTKQVTPESISDTDKKLLLDAWQFRDNCCCAELMTGEVRPFSLSVKGYCWVFSPGFGKRWAFASRTSSIWGKPGFLGLGLARPHRQAGASAGVDMWGTRIWRQAVRTFS